MTRVLVVEDEVDLCELIATHLEAEGHTVDRAYDGLAALQVAETATPDLVILDWMLPGLDRLSVARRLRLRAPDADRDAHRPRRRSRPGAGT